MAGGVRILGTVTRPCQTKRLGPSEFGIVLTQGLNRQIRRMCVVFGYRVKRLRRVRIMDIELADLKVGGWRELTQSEAEQLLARCALHPDLAALP
jgi:23S rRNA pseudouridine2604 synthase